MDSVPQFEQDLVPLTYADENAERFEPNRAVAAAASQEEFGARMAALAQELGFIRIGVAAADPFVEAGQRFQAWLAKGHAGNMDYLAEFPDRHVPGRLLANAKTVVVLAAAVPRRPRDNESPLSGRVADYAVGLDYHIALRSRLRRIGQGLADCSGRVVWTRPCIDTAPLLEREAARRAGIGFVAKSTMLIVPGVGPRVLLASLVTDLDCSVGQPMDSRCGSCTACIDACPTQAFVGPYELDARRCLSYLTIEHQGQFPEELRGTLQNRLVGCDVCQDVCSYERSAAARVMPSDASPRPLLAHPNLVRWLEMSSTDYRRIAKRTALRRIGRAQLMRNAAIALGNSGDQRAVASLESALKVNRSPLARGHVAWALGRLGGRAAEQSLRSALEIEEEPSVRQEIESALRRLGSENV